MRQPNIHTASVIRVMKALLVSYLITGLLLLLMAGLMYRFQMDEGKIQIGMIVTYLLSCFIGGFLTGKMMKSRQFLWGAVMGLLYFLIMLLVSLAVNRELQANSSGFITSFLLCIGGGTLGGMLS
ncbi:MAG: TIGR04086 family membrane protein, partial [Lachnospiraceae bacterium]|nr:TIGR04086 family membrane protein [Lachnospiraceae bacterium]